MTDKPIDKEPFLKAAQKSIELIGAQWVREQKDKVIMYLTVTLCRFLRIK